jgi:hypothetical protein
LSPGSCRSGLITADFRLSQTTNLGTPPSAANRFTCAPSQSASPSLARASAKMKFEAPIVATNSRACQTTPVAGSVTPIVSPAKSTNTFSPATWLCRIVGDRRHFHSS